MASVVQLQLWANIRRLQTKMVSVRSISTTNALSWNFKEYRRRRRDLWAQAKAAEVAAQTGVETPETKAFVKPFGYNDMIWRKGVFRPVHSWQTSVKYLESQTYKKIYADKPVWVPYKRNTQKVFFSRHLPLHNCCPLGIFQTNHPCPICRDEYLVVDFRNVKLLLQFVIPSTSRLIDILRVQVCQTQYFNIEVAVERAKAVGYLDYGVIHRHYNYKDYYDWWEGGDEEPPPVEAEEYQGMHQLPYIKYKEHNREWWPKYDF